MLKGTLAKFSPGDLLSFLSHLNQEGVLSVGCDNVVLNIFFRGGQLVAAHSEQADNKVLAGLLADGLVTADQFAALDRARRETGLPLRQLLEDTGGIHLDPAAGIIETGIREVLFQLFGWETGEFQFNELPVPQTATAPSFPCTGLVMDAARQIDEYREFVRRFKSEDQIVALTEAGRTARDGKLPLAATLRRVDGRLTLKQLIQTAPGTSFEVMKALDEALQSNLIGLRTTAGAGAGPENPPSQASDSALFLAYKRSSQRVLQAADRQARIEELVAYCRGQFDYFLLLSFAEDRVLRCVRFRREAAGDHQGVELPATSLGLADDPAFRFVAEARTPFFGEAFVSPLLKGLGEPDPAGECAIIPLGGKGNRNFMLFVSANQEDRIPGPLHYLEMIAWQIHAPSRAGQPEPAAAPARPAAVAGPSQAAADMIAAVNELPPMPQVVSRVMELLSDADSPMSHVVAVLSHDPTLVARLIRVSNSALYRRGGDTSSLGQAVVRLGANAVRSLVMAASVKSLFPVDRTSVGIWGQSLWRHSIECALAARKVAQLVAYPDPEEAFVAGALHDIGRVAILLHRTEEFRQIHKQHSSVPGDIMTVERAVLGFDHTEVGDLLLAKWQMPANLRACVRHHHDLACEAPERRLVLITAAGNHLSDLYGAEPAGPVEPGVFDAVWAELGLGAAQVATLVGDIGACLEHGGLLD